jgi:hypothetical protein
VVTPVILAHWEGDIRKTTVPSQAEQRVREPIFKIIRAKIDWSNGSSGRVPAL